MCPEPQVLIIAVPEISDSPEVAFREIAGSWVSHELFGSDPPISGLPTICPEPINGTFALFSTL
jgi:hypothetical protein